MRKSDLQTLTGGTVRQALQTLAERNELRQQSRRTIRPGTADHVQRNIALWQAEQKLRLVHIDRHAGPRLSNPVLP